MRTVQETPTEIENLQNIYQQWQELKDPQNKLARMTAILPFISLAGLLLAKYPDNTTLRQIRQDFKEYYEKNNPKKLEWRSADFDSEFIEKLTKYSSQNEYAKLNLLQTLYSYQDKYHHANFVAYFNLADILKDVNLDGQTDIGTIIKKIKTRLEKEFSKPDELEKFSLLNQISEELLG